MNHVKYILDFYEFIYKGVAKMRTNNKSIVLNIIISIIQIALGGFWLFIFGVAFIGNLLDAENTLEATSVMLFIIFISLSAYTFYCGIKRTKMNKTLKNYVNVIGNVESISIEDLAKSVLVSESQVVSEFEWLIKKSILTDAYIDHNDKKIVFKEAYAKVVEKQKQEEQEKRNIEYVSVVCGCCDGTTKIVKGKEGVCSYCGAPIK